MKNIPILWKHSLDPFCFQERREITQEEAQAYLDAAGLGSSMPLAIIQVDAHRSGTVKVKDGYIHYMPNDH